MLRAVPLLAALALGQAGAIEKPTFVRMDDGVRLNKSLSMADGTAAPNGWPAIVFAHGLGGSKAAASAWQRARVRHSAKGAS